MMMTRSPSLVAPAGAAATTTTTRRRGLNTNIATSRPKRVGAALVTLSGGGAGSRGSLLQRRASSGAAAAPSSSSCAAAASLLQRTSTPLGASSPAPARRGASIVPTAIAEPDVSTLPMNADTSEKFNWHMQWYPVAFTADLTDDAPYPFTLLGEPLVFWKDPLSAEYRCTADRCPHRMVPLSEGRINEKGEIECAYHGWTFDGKDGSCTGIPQLPKPSLALDTALNSPRACVTPYPTAVAQGILWVLPVNALNAPAEADRPPLPLIPELDHPDCVVQDIHRDLPMDFSTLLENVMDVSHVPFTHHNSVGKRENATPVELEMVGKLAANGFTGIWKEGPRKGKYGSQFTQFQAPNLMRHTLITDQFTTLTVVYAVPTTPGRCRLMARFPFIFKAKLPKLIFPLVPRWYSHMNQNSILEDDQIFLHKQERLIEVERNFNNKTYAQACYMPTKADVYVNAFRRWIAEIAGGHPDWPKGMVQKLPAQEVTREALLDRFHSHTVNCKSCAVALANITKARKALRVASLVALVGAAAAFARSMPVHVVVLTALLAAALAGVREVLGGFVGKMKVGPYPPPRRPPSMMEAALETARIALI